MRKALSASASSASLYSSGYQALNDQTRASSYRSLSVLLQHTDFANPMQSFWSFPMEQEVRDATWCSFSGAISDFKCVVISTDTCMSFFFDYLVLFFFLFYRKRFGQKTGTKGDQGSKTLGSWNEGATISELPNPANACASLFCWIMWKRSDHFKKKKSRCSVRPTQNLANSQHGQC